MTTAAPLPPALPLVLIPLMKGVLHAEEDAARWAALLALQARVRDHVTLLGLDLVLDETEGYAYLHQRPSDEDGDALPRLIPRRQLGFSVSLLLALLRRRLAEFDASSAEDRLILSRADIIDLLRLFYPAGSNEARVDQRIDADIKKVAELGFLRRLRGQDDRYEVRRILKAFIDAQWLNDFEQRLAEYRTHLASASPDEEPPP
ncbi:MAG: DUF4194 domain-containing protein [Rhodospirillaceae bacterium]